MTLLSPLALLWLGSIPALLWIWRLASTHRQVRVPSLIPFERLLKRLPRRRTRLVVNTLFWLQLAALIGLTLALAQPILFQRRAKTILAVLDTSASMGAHARGPSAFEHAKQALLTEIARKAPTDQWFIMTTSPVAPLTLQPTGDTVALTRAVQALRVNHLGGNLSTTVRIGLALLATDPDETVVMTDEARPSDLSGEAVRWVRVGEPLANVAIVGLDAQGPLCHPSDARVIATIQNFSNETSTVMVAATQGGQRLAEARAEFAPRARESVSLVMPEGTEGWVEIALAVQGDGLGVDDRAWLDLCRPATPPIVVRSQSPAFKQTISTWLGACLALTWTVDGPRDSDPPLVITDREEDARSSAAAAMVFLRPTSVQPVVSHWVVSSGHPVGSYLAPVGAVAATLNLSAGPVSSGVPVVSALVNGRKVPVVVADERDGRRIVSMLLEPTGNHDSLPILLAFFNSLRWLTGSSERKTTGEPVTLSGFRPGTVRVHRPDGFGETVEAHGGTFRYDATTVAGRYRFSQGSSEMTVAVNFFNPIESNLVGRISTWRAPPNASMTAGIPSPRIAFYDRRGGQAARPLSNLLVLLILGVLLIEWWLYRTKGQATVHHPEITATPR
jgi:hypothetical protein